MKHNVSRRILNGTRGLYIGAMEKNREGGFKSRTHVVEALMSIGVTVWNHYNNPIRSDSDEGDAEMFERFEQWREEENYEAIHECGKPIRNKDLALIDKCDFVICELDMEKLSCGTWEELFLANRHKKPVFVFCKQGKKAIPLWMWWTLPINYFYNNLEEVIDTLKKIDTGDIVIDNDRWKLLRPEFR